MLIIQSQDGFNGVQVTNVMIESQFVVTASGGRRGRRRRSLVILVVDGRRFGRRKRVGDGHDRRENRRTDGRIGAGQ